jgi:hypothetical protein
MSRPSRDKSTEHLNVIDGFKIHGKGMSEVIAHLRTVVEGSASNAEYRPKVKDVESRFSAIQSELLNLISSVSFPSAPSVREEYLHGTPVIIRCKQWEDFKAQASKASTVSFLYRAEERAFQVDALKEDRVYTFSGQLPNDASLLKIFLSKELCVDEGRVLEGVLAIG